MDAMPPTRFSARARGVLPSFRLAALRWATRPRAVLALTTLLAICAPAFGQDDPDNNLMTNDLGSGIAPQSLGESIAGTLAFKVAEPGSRGPVSRRPSIIELSTTAPVEFKALPTFVGTPLFATLRLGRSGRVYLALDRASEDSNYFDRMYIDSNTNRDLTDDGLVVGVSADVSNRGRRYTEFTNVQFDLYYGQDTNEPFALTLYIWYPVEGDPTQLFVVSSSWREGVIDLKGERAIVGVFDENNDGLFQQKSCRWSLVREDERDRLFSPEVTVPLGVPIRVSGKPYRIADIMPEGRRFELITETESKTRQAELSWDPLQSEPIRPLATEEIQWISDFDLARSRAATESKPVMVLFSVDWSESSKNLDERTLVDAGVVEVLERDFVCVRMNPDLHPELARRYEIEAAPTTLVLDEEGQVRVRITGYRAPRTYAALLTDAR